MPSVNLKDINPVVFLHNVAIGADIVPDEKLVLRGNLQIEHDNTGQGIRFKSTASTGNKSAISWVNSLGIETWKLIHDNDANKTDDIRLLKVPSVNAITVSKNGRVSLGTTDTSTDAALTINVSSGADSLISFNENDTSRWKIGSHGDSGPEPKIFIIQKSSGQRVLRISDDDESNFFIAGKVGIGLTSAADILEQRASLPTSTTSQLLTVKGEARFYQDDPYDTGTERGIILSWDVVDNTGVIDTTDISTFLEFDVGGNRKFILNDAGTEGKSSGTQGWIKVNLGGSGANGGDAPIFGYIKVYTAK